MSVDCVEITAEHLPAVRELLLQHWRRNWTPEVVDRFLRWRLLERPIWTSIAALDGDRCVAFVDSFVRPYSINGRQLLMREASEWVCLPEYRPLVSLKVLQSLMKKDEPIITTSASDVATGVLSRMKWELVCQQEQYVMPLGIGALVKGFVQKFDADLFGALPPFIGQILPFRFRRPRRFAHPDQSATVSEICSTEEISDIRPPDHTFALYALADHNELSWFRNAPEGEGKFIWLKFSIGGKPVGLSMSRLFRQGPYRGAKLLHLQSTKHDPETYSWLLSETSLELAKRGAHWIDARFTCPMIATALETIGYRKTKSWPIYVWPRDRFNLEGEIFVGGMMGEHGLHPYPYRSNAVLS